MSEINHQSEPASVPDLLQDSPVPDTLRELVNAQLMDDETVQWIDLPIPYYFSVRSAIEFGGGIFVILVGSFFVYLGVSNLLRSGYALTHLMILIFFFCCFVVGVFMLFEPLQTRRKSGRTVYAVTNLRAIIVQGMSSGSNVTSYYPADFVDVFCKQRINGTGNLYFIEHFIERWGFIQWFKVQWFKGGFVNIRNVKEVERMLQELKRTKPPE